MNASRKSGVAERALRGLATGLFILHLIFKYL